ncbi:hypothetical protein POV26_07190 [Aequorivita todarodis]|uniref:hypothetical protein n=1 Tax=Aequorivita todarodis TaxID=2036821 RepID=UPI00234FECC7|nr:hypothetical protein [Aequorivita todarodis]MDC8000816.1 hypothetical protein [Aequorivita todarodis]
MKKLIFYFGIVFVICLSFSCERDPENFNVNKDQEVVQNTTETEGKTAFQTNCDIVSPASINTNTSGVYKNSNAKFTYQSNIPNPSVYWSIPSNSGISIVSGQNTATITLAFSNTFNGATISANGVDGILNCSDIENIIVGGCGSSCCIPELDSYWICGGWPYGHGAVYIDFTGCDSSVVDRIHWQLSGAKFISGPLTGYSSGTTYGPASPGNIDGQCGVPIHVTATVYYNNGCPTQTLEEDVDTF